MISLLLLIAGAVLVVLGILDLLVNIVGAAWWVLLLVGLILLIVGWYLRSGRRPTAV